MKDSVRGVVFDIRRHSLHDGPGIRTAFFLKGCPLSCLWCHNPEGLGFGPEIQHRPERCISCGACGRTRSRTSACPTGAIEAVDRALTPAQALRLALADEHFYDASGGGITFTGGEPLAQGEFLLETIKLFKNHGLSICLDTSGYASEKLVVSLAPFLDLVLYDLKHMNDEVHRKLTGVPNKKILRNVRILASLGVPLLFSIPLIPGLNDDEPNLLATAEFIAGLGRENSFTPEVRILPYHSSAAVKYGRKGLNYACQDVPTPDQESCEKAASLFQSGGLKTSIGGL